MTDRQAPPFATFTLSLSILMAKKLFLIAVDPESDFGKSLKWFLEENHQADKALCVDVDRDMNFVASKNQSISLLPSIKGVFL